MGVQVRTATFGGEGQSLPIIERQFISFSWGGKNIEDFDLLVVFDDRLNKGVYAGFNDSTSSYTYIDGQTYWGTTMSAGALTLKLATDGMDSKTYEEFKAYFRPGIPRELILSEYPFRYTMARISSPPQISMLPFEKEITTEYGTFRTTEYKGEITLNFVMDDPYWYNTENSAYFQEDVLVREEVKKDVYETGTPIFGITSVLLENADYSYTSSDDKHLYRTIYYKIDDCFALQGKGGNITFDVVMPEADRNENNKVEVLCYYNDSTKVSGNYIYQYKAETGSKKIHDTESFPITDTLHVDMPLALIFEDVVEEKHKFIIRVRVYGTIQSPKTTNMISNFNFTTRMRIDNCWYANKTYVGSDGLLVDSNSYSYALSAGQNYYIKYCGTVEGLPEVQIEYPVQVATNNPPYIQIPYSGYLSDVNTKVNKVQIGTNIMLFTLPPILADYNQAIKVIEEAAKSNLSIIETKARLREQINTSLVRKFALAVLSKVASDAINLDSDNIQTNFYGQMKTMFDQNSKIILTFNSSTGDIVCQYQYIRKEYEQALVQLYDGHEYAGSCLKSAMLTIPAYADSNKGVFKIEAPNATSLKLDYKYRFY